MAIQVHPDGHPKYHTGVCRCPSPEHSSQDFVPTANEKRCGNSAVTMVFVLQVAQKLVAFHQTAFELFPFSFMKIGHKKWPERDSRVFLDFW